VLSISIMTIAEKFRLFFLFSNNALLPSFITKLSVNVVLCILSKPDLISSLTSKLDTV